MAHDQEHSAQHISAAFVSQYYNTLLKNTKDLFKFYKEDSTASHVEHNETGKTATGLKAIREMFEAMDFSNVRIRLQFVDAQSSLNGSIFIIANGILSTSSSSREFTQGFILAAQQPKGFYVRNDVFRFLTAHDGPDSDAKKTQPPANFATYGSHGPDSPNSSTAAVPSRVLADEQLSDVDSTAATAGGSVVNTEDVISQTALSESALTSKENGHAGPSSGSSSSSSNGSVSSAASDELELSSDEKSVDKDSINGPTTSQKAVTPEEDSAVESKEKDKPAPQRKGRERPPRSHERRNNKRQQPKKKKENGDEVTEEKGAEEKAAKKEQEQAEKKDMADGKQAEEKQEPASPTSDSEAQPVEEKPAVVENPTSWAHAVGGPSYKPAEPVATTQKSAEAGGGRGKRERGGRRDKEQTHRGDRVGRRSDAAAKGGERDRSKRESSASAGKNQRSIFVGKLDPATTEDDLRQAFDQYGKVARVVNKAAKGSFAYVYFENRESVEKALQKEGSLVIKGSTVNVQRNLKEEKTGRFGSERREFKGGRQHKGGESGAKKDSSGDEKDKDRDSGEENDGGWSISHRGRGGRPRGGRGGGRPARSGGHKTGPRDGKGPASAAAPGTKRN